MTQTAARFIVAGRVQGVAFRAFTRQRAAALGLCGHARNLRDGRVEVLAAGELAAIEALADWLWIGSPHARVESVQREPAPAPEWAGFEIG
jgi:acylphosphatase